MATSIDLPGLSTIKSPISLCSWKSSCGAGIHISASQIFLSSLSGGWSAQAAASHLNAEASFLASDILMKLLKELLLKSVPPNWCRGPHAPFVTQLALCAVHVRRGVIEWVVPSSERPPRGPHPVLDYGSSVIMPGLVDS